MRVNRSAGTRRVLRRALLPGLWALALGAGLSGCASTPAEDDPTQLKLNDLEARLARIERVMSNQSLVQMAQNQDALQAEVRRLRGRIEELENSNEAIRKQQHDLYSDLDKRIAGSAGSAGPSSGAPSGVGSAAAAAGSAGAAGAAGAATGAAAGGGSPSSVEQAVYNQAFSALKAGSYSVAITSFRDFLSNYPGSPLAENAQYWLGEAYYVTRDYDGAAASFRTVLQQWPQSRKAPDALLKIGFTQFEQKKFAESRRTLEDVIQKYPDSDPAKLAADKLKRFPANAH